jgi:hypothetical protein
LSQNSANGNSSQNSGNAFKGDRFIPFRGIQDNYFEEFILSNDLYNKDSRKDEGGAVAITSGNSNNGSSTNVPESN